MERKKLTESELLKAIRDIETDDEMAPEEKELVTKIYSAALSDVRTDERVRLIVKQINNQRIKMIDTIVGLLPSLSDEKKEVAEEMLHILCLGCDEPVLGDKYFRVDDFVKETMVPGVGTIDIYVDDNLHKERLKMDELENKLKSLLLGKYENLQDNLEGIIDPEMFVLDSKVKKDEKDEIDEYRTREEVDKVYIEERNKVDKLDTFSQVKGILRGILDDTRKSALNGYRIDANYEDLYEYKAILEEQLGRGNGKR